MNGIAKRLKALSDPTRLRVIRLLDRGEMCVCDVMAALGLPQSRVSRHLAYLDN
ncbi:MAG: transcriptional regulator, partial [Desulfovibrio sp.]|nr:transcriptional regulator [Desulfovibrio sp.]